MITNAICLNWRNAGTYMSLQIHIIGLRSMFFVFVFPLDFTLTLSSINFNKKSIDCTGAPSISSEKHFFRLHQWFVFQNYLPNIMQFGRLFSAKNDFICVPFSNASLNASGLRSSDAFISTTLYPACWAMI